MIRDLTHATRTLARSPGYSFAVVLTLALGIGGTAAVTSVLRSVLLRPLSYAPADRVFLALERDSTGNERLASYPTFRDWRAGTSAFEALAFVRGLGAVMRTSTGAERLVGAYVSQDFFLALSDGPLLGRTLIGSDFQPGSPGAVVLSHRLWQRRFGGDRSALGRAITVGSRSYTLVGVMGPDFGYPPWADLYAPISAIEVTDAALAQRGVHVDSRVVGRLRMGVDSVAARGALSAVAARLADDYPGESGGWRSVSLYPVADEILAGVGPQLRLLTVAAGFVLLIACVNIANLSLARATARARELAIRTALGAGRGALLRLLAAESLVLGAAATALGLFGALWLVGWIKASAASLLPRVDAIGLDGWVVLGTAAVSIVLVVAFGLLPALATRGGALIPALKDGGGAGSGRARQRLRAALVVAEFALALMLLVGAGLLVRSLQQLQQVRPGFDLDHLVAIPIDPPSPRYDEPAQALALYDAIAEAARAVPGVRSVGLTNHVPLSGASITSRFEVAGAPPDSGATAGVLFRSVDAGYFGTAGIPIVAGRGFERSDMVGPGSSVIVNQTLARRYWPDRNPVGESVVVHKAAQGRTDFGKPVRATVVGVVGDVRHFALEADFEPEVYVPYTLTVWPRIAVLVRAEGAPDAVALGLKRAVLGVDPDIPLEGADFRSGVQTLASMLDATLAYRRLVTGLLAAFALPALLLAALGIYGVIAYLVVQRSHEIAIRMALGASRGAVVQMVLRQGLRLALAGAGLGVLGSVAASRLLQAQLFGVSPTDYLTLSGATGILVLVGLIATYVPARRSAKVPPMRVLQSQ
ncbi:MAG: ABC transporter permease [Gemmatimonadales bacterium]|nr:ABC transporter permease [Gemmatimonadales bacterium]